MKRPIAKYYTAAWDPLDGCLHACRHCSAKVKSEQYGGHRSFASYMAQDEPIDTGTLRILDFPMRDEVTGAREEYPFMFSPTYHRYRLTELPPRESPETILACGNGDLLGPWVDNRIVEEVFERAKAVDWHTYIFLTRNPAGYDTLGEHSGNMLLGAVVDSQEQANAIIDSKTRSLDYLNLSPLNANIKLKEFLDNTQSKIRWVIASADFGAFVDAGWITAAAGICAERGIPLFCDQSLETLMGNTFRQETPLPLHKRWR